MLYIDGELRKYLGRLTKPFAKFLEKVLKPLYPEDWWREAVIDSFKRRNYSLELYNKLIQKKKLEDYDISSLFTILNHNWKALVEKTQKRKKHDDFHGNNFNHFYTFVNDNKKYFDRMLNLRNTVAHEGYPPIEKPAEAYEHLNKIQKFAELINAEKELNHATREQLYNLLDEKVLKLAIQNKDVCDKPAHAYKELEKCDTAIKIEFFFWYNIYDDNGINSFKLLTDRHLTTFEYIRDEFKKLCGY
jgi:hypothetical protein